MKRPRLKIGATIVLVTGESSIRSFPLYQPDSPDSYFVDDADGVSRSIRWDGECWIENGLSSGVEADAPALPEAGEATGDTRSQSTLAARREELCPSSPVEVRSNSESSDSPAQISSGFTFGKRDVKPTRKRRQRKVEPSETPVINITRHPVHSRLDDARDAYRMEEGKSSPDADRVQELFERYTTEIEAVNRLNPGFYLGNPPLKPLPAYVAPDFRKFSVSDPEPEPEPVTEPALEAAP